MRYVRQFPAKNEDGLVALLVVGIMVILLSLTTVAFTKLMGRESQQAVDRALSTQAYYAAQSGINDAKDYLNTHPGADLSGGACNTLALQGYPPFLGSNTDDVNKVTCIVADTTPDRLFFQIPAGRSRIFEMSSAASFGRILFSWDNANLTTYSNGNYRPFNAQNFPTATPGGWNTGPFPAPILEVTYYPLPDNSPDLASQINLGRTIYLYPSLRAGAGAPTYNSNPDGMIVNNTCHQNNTNLGSFPGASAVYHCDAIVAPSASRHIFVKVTALYQPASLAVLASSPGGSAVPITGAQAVLDATGKGGSDVVKRLQTIINYRQSDIDPGDTLEVLTGLCKRLEYNLTTQVPQIDSSEDTVSPSYDPVTSPACHTGDL